MVIADHPPGQPARYHLFETVRQYAREKLNEAGETDRLHTRHRDYFLDFAENNYPKLQTPEGPVLRPIVAAERDNLRQAVEWSFSGDLSNIEAGPRIVIAMMYSPWRGVAKNWIGACAVLPYASAAPMSRRCCTSSCLSRLPL
jgi:hypothetical protein